MSNQKDSQRPLTLNDFGRFPAEFHSLTKQTSFRIRFCVDFECQKLPKIHKMSCIGALLVSAFWNAKLVFFGRTQSENHWARCLDNGIEEAGGGRLDWPIRGVGATGARDESQMPIALQRILETF